MKRSTQKILAVLLAVASVFGAFLATVAAAEDAQAPTIVSVCGNEVSSGVASMPAATVGTAYQSPAGEKYKIIALGSGKLTYSASEYETEAYGRMPQGLHLDPDTGEFYGTVTTPGTFNISVTVSNEYGSVNIMASIMVFNESDKPVITTERFSNGAVGSYYMQEIEFTGYKPSSYSVSIISGALPDGLRVSASGFGTCIQGTPTKTGTFAFTLRIDTGAGTATKDYTIEITEEAIRPSLLEKDTIIKDAYSFLNSSNDICVIKGKPVEIQLVSSGTNTEQNPIWYDLRGTLPEGLTMSETGLITGTPSEDIETPYGYKYFYNIYMIIGNKKVDGGPQSTGNSITIVVYENGHVNRISLTPNATSVAKGGQRQLEIDWSQAYGDVDKTAIEWRIYGKQSADTYISETGLLNVGIDETARSIRVWVKHTPSGREGSCDVTIVDHAHTTTVVDAVEKTCTTDGNRKHFVCTVCGERFADALAAQLLTEEDVKIPAGHEYGTLIPAQNATCSALGTQAHFECTLCHALFDADKAEKTESELQIPIDAAAHKFGGWKAEVPADCATEGVKAHKACAYCNKHFDDANAEIADLTIAKNDDHLLQPDWSKDASGHWHVCTRAGCKDGGKLDFAAHEKSAETATETADVHCTLCQYVIEPVKGHTHVLQLVAGHSQTCTKPGEKAYYVCADGENPCGRFFEDKDATTEITADIDTWKVIPAGHVFGEWIAEVPASVDAFGVKAHKDCALCGKHFDADGNEQSEDDLKLEKLPAPGAPDEPTAPNDPTAPATPDPDENAPSGGAIAAIVIGGIAVVGLGGFAVVWFVVRKKKLADLVAIFKKGRK